MGGREGGRKRERNYPQSRGNKRENGARDTRRIKSLRVVHVSLTFPLSLSLLSFPFPLSPFHPLDSFIFRFIPFPLPFALRFASLRRPSLPSLSVVTTISYRGGIPRGMARAIANPPSKSSRSSGNLNVLTTSALRRARAGRCDQTKIARSIRDR